MANQGTDGHWRMQLNNLLQANAQLGTLEWELTCRQGHQGPWTAVAYVGDTEYGRGLGMSKNAAKEAAAKQAYEAIAQAQG
ncbi:uncharacterized protein B0H18DRAFT_1042656 [Fomitopsis serialis]|uniref:uncharacterized protein n=1 Tax=Fomitopsis serialis TaxID=139415 RepID=UPI0020075039|nr:uncharacterized protein B0H18DRAFT_1042656 [Neoantrodia serialis]KAH9915126.1 hypothetical protein B0H18DRAFT_1042656 [Neoantrodia serialis]